MSRRVVVTGLGMATGLGLSVEESWCQAMEGRSGIAPLPELYRQSPVRAAGQVKACDWQTIGEAYPRYFQQEAERRTLFALWAAGQAWRDAGLTTGGPAAGVAMGAGLGIQRMEDEVRWRGEDGRIDFRKMAAERSACHRESQVWNLYDRPPALLASQWNLQGPQVTVTTACASATQAIGTACRLIQRGEAEVMLAGGADSMIHPVGLIYFVLLGAASTSADPAETVCRPFDRRRTGLVMGEGAGMVILESESHARARGARIYAELAGYASSMDGWRVTAPHPEGDGAARAMQAVLAGSGLNREDIDYLNAHGTGTKLNDAAETLAVKKVFGDHAGRLVITSSKPFFGHLLAACGGPELIFTVLSVQRDEVPPTLNLTHPDPKCDLNYLPLRGEKRRIRAALSNSFGFGGENGCLAVKKYLA